MHFLNLFSTTSLHCWKDCSGMPLSSVELMILLSLKKRKKITLNEIKKKGWLFKYEFLVGQELANAQCTQFCYFLDMPKSVGIIFRALTFFMFSWLVIIQTVHQQSHNICFTSSMLTSTTCWLPSAPGVIFNHPTLLCEPLVPLKDMYTRHGVISITCWSISGACGGVFPNQSKNFRFISCSVLRGEKPEKEV